MVPAAPDPSRAVPSTEMRSTDPPSVSWAAAAAAADAAAAAAGIAFVLGMA